MLTLPLALMLLLTASSLQVQPAAMNGSESHPQSVPRTKHDALDRYIRQDMNAQHIPAAVFGVFKDGKMLSSGAYGYANLELGTRATTNTVFEIGSAKCLASRTLTSHGVCARAGGH